MINYWPESQKCITCAHGELLINYPACTYWCDQKLVAETGICNKTYKEKEKQ